MKKIICVCSVLFLGACNPLYNGGGQPLAKMTFEHIKPSPVYVASYEPIAFARAVTLPEGFITDPSNLVYDYLTARFKVSGSSGKLRIAIKDVSVKHEIIKSDNKMGAVLGVGSSDHYIVTIVIGVRLYGMDSKAREVTLTAKRNISVSEHVTLVERELAQMQGLDALIDDLDISIRDVLKSKNTI